MEQHSLERINSSQIKDFFRSLCMVSSRYEKKEHPAYETLKHLENKHFKTSENQRFSVPQKSKRFSREINKSEAAIEKELKDKIFQLEHELHQTRQERDKSIGENREQIHELNVSLLSIKTRMNEILEHKKQRERRVRELERKIREKVN